MINTSVPYEIFDNLKYNFKKTRQNIIWYISQLLNLPIGGEHDT